MTLKLRRILLSVGDPRIAPRAAMQKAASIARAAGAEIELFHALEELSPAARVRGARDTEAAGAGPSAARARASASSGSLLAARRRLERMARSSLLRGCRIRVCVALGSPPHEAIVRRALASRADLVVAGCRAHGRARRLFLRNTDWELIRYCPCPLLLAKSRGAYRAPRILVAVDPFHVHAKPARLDDRLLAAGRDLARVLHGSVDAFHAYRPLIASVQGPLGEPVVWESPAIEEVHGVQVRRAFDRLAEKAGVSRSRRHLVMGDVPSELDAAVRRLRAHLVVMGAVSRSALGRLLIGSTAERVLDELACDVLIVKPRSFKTVPQIRRRR